MVLKLPLSLQKPIAWVVLLLPYKQPASMVRWQLPVLVLRHVRQPTHSLQVGMLVMLWRLLTMQRPQLGVVLSLIQMPMDFPSAPDSGQNTKKPAEAGFFIAPAPSFPAIPADHSRWSRADKNFPRPVWPVPVVRWRHADCPARHSCRPAPGAVPAVC